MLAYLDAEKEERKARRAVKRELNRYLTARKHKYNALCVAIPEYSFLMGREEIQPEINGEYVISKLINGIIEKLDDGLLTVVASLTKAEEEIEEVKNEEDIIGNV